MGKTIMVKLKPKLMELKKEIRKNLKKHTYDLYAIGDDSIVVDIYNGYDAQNNSLRVDLKKDGTYDSKLTIFRNKEDYPKLKRNTFIKRKKTKTTKPILKLMRDWVWCECHVD